MKRIRKKDYKYEIIELRPGIWNDYNNSHKPLEYWHLIIKCHDEYAGSAEVLENVQRDFSELFGYIEVRDHVAANREAFDLKQTNECFQTKIYWKKNWIVDLYLRNEFCQEIKILR